MGMYLMRQIGTRGVYGDPVLPDFMVFLNYKELPWFWHGFDMFWFAMLMVVARAGLARAGLRLAGVPLARHRRLSIDHHPGAHLCADARVLPQRHGFRRQQRHDRFQGHPRVFHQCARRRASRCSWPPRWRWSLGYLACRYITLSRAGRVVQAIRDAESRTRFIGYRVESYKLWIFAFSAVLAGIAGALYVPQVGIINPSEFQPINSIEVVIWVAVGGRGMLYGAVAGAVLVNYAKTFFTAALPEFWLYALGALFVLVTLFLPRGVVGLLDASAEAAAARRPTQSGDRMNATQVVKQGWQKVFGAGTGSDRPMPGDASHGTILYLEDITVSFDGFRALNNAHAVHRRGRAALHHRPERRRQDHDDGRDHRQDAPRCRLRLVRHHHRSAHAHRTRNRGGRHRTQVSEADGVRTAHVSCKTWRSRPRATSRSGTRCSNRSSSAQRRAHR